MTWYTRPQPSAAPLAQEISPALLFHKWHAYDGPSLETKDSRGPYLKRVARSVDAVAASPMYKSWYESCQKALAALGVETFSARTAGRLVAGMATNPALETGLQLHHLLGVPCLTGSAIKGLLHHVAEMELGETRGVADGSILEDAEAFEDLLRRAEEIWTLFGSLTVEPAREDRNGVEERLGPETVRSKLVAWRRDKRIPEDFEDRVSALLDTHTGGRLACYDAMPVADQTELLEVDVLNPHYPLYYRSEGEVAPSDDQDPVPVAFLVVKAGVELVFPWRLREESEDAVGESSDRDRQQVRDWFASALGGWGAGGKTAAGYGYFVLENQGEDGDKKGTAASERAEEPKASEPESLLWRGARLSWVPNKGELEAESEGKTARSDRKELLELLPENARDRLTRKKNRKTLVCDVEVVQRSQEWFELMGIRFPSD